jgi:hypothetical protein
MPGDCFLFLIKEEWSENGETKDTIPIGQYQPYNH